MIVTPHAQDPLPLFVDCPHCQTKSAHRVDHLVSGGHKTFGPWWHECGGGIRGVVLPSGDIDLAMIEERRIKTLVLLKMVDRFVVVESERPSTEGVEDTSGHNRYYYEEHTCETNVFRYIKEVFVMAGDTVRRDPHETFEHLDTIDAPTDEMDDEAVRRWIDSATTRAQ